jgi:hypothetical protein
VSFSISRFASYWGTWAALGVVVACEIATFWWFTPGFLAALGFAALGIAALLAWIPFFIGSKADSGLIEAAQQLNESATVKVIQALETDLRRLGATQAVEQLRAAAEKYQSVTDVLGRKLNAGELAFGKHRRVAEQVYFAVVDNLGQVAASLTSTASINADKIGQRLREITDGTEQAGSAAERATLLERQALLESQQDKVSMILAQNETALTGLSSLGVRWAEVRTSQGHADIDPDTALAELERLAAGVKRFDIDGDLADR